MPDSAVTEHRFLPLGLAVGSSQPRFYLLVKELNGFQTKPWVCDLMIQLLPTATQTVLEPTPGEGGLVARLRQHGFTVTAPIDFWGVSGWFDAIVMNPPFTPMSLGYKMLWRAMAMTDTVIALMPWLVLINSQHRTRQISEYGLRSVTHLPRSAFPGARVQTCILNLQRGYKGGHALNFALPRIGVE